MTESNDEATSTHQAVRVGDLVPTFGFRGADMDPGENAAAWREAVATLFDVDELAHGEPDAFRADLISYAMGSVVLGVSRASGQHFLRTLDTIARSGIDHVIVQLYTQGGYDGVAGDRPMRVRAGDVCVFDLAQTLETRATPFENVTLVVPRPMLAMRLPRPDVLHGLVLPRASVMAAMIGRHLQALAELAPRMTLADCEAITEGSVNLVCACLRAETERHATEGVERSVDLIIRIKQHIEARLAEPGLSGETIAGAFGLSRAALYRLFTAEGGVVAYLRNRRLHRAFFDLATPDGRVKDVAQRWHLGSEETFIRAFRAAYGITPTMARRAALTLHERTATDDGATSQLSRWMRGMALPP